MPLAGVDTNLLVFDVLCRLATVAVVVVASVMAEAAAAAVVVVVVVIVGSYFNCL